jgi:serine/threonine protein kinase/tetratricopeptide (TPR) repeat protein
MASEQPPPSSYDTAAGLARGATIGRYVVLSLVGRGGMGDVYAAYDPELDRKIAVKLLRTRATAGQSEVEGRTRLLREAQAIAKLSHPNVVVVYDVGTFRDTVFIAMEFIEGDTIRYWLNAAPRGWREVLRVFLAAGRGLAAAHDAGIVHRDFKPDNVMVGRDDGKVRVMDFGLARQTSPSPETPARGVPAAAVVAAVATTPAPPAPAASASAAPAVIAPASTSAAPVVVAPVSAPAVAARARTRSDADIDATRVLPPPGTALRGSLSSLGALPEGVHTSQNALEASLTLTGAMLGTPAYMAPEQFKSKGGDARTDQFSFCVALYESLYGERPFDGKSLMSLMANVVHGDVRDAPAGTRVPTWIRRVLLRGLRPAPDDRYPSMGALLAALERDPAVARRRWLVGASTALIAAAVAFGVSRNLEARHSPCEGGPAKLAGIWEPGLAPTPRKLAVRAAFRATGKGYAEQTFETVRRALDRYAGDWAHTYRDACEATAVRGEQSADVLDLRMSCLQDRLSSVKALVDVYDHADGDVVERAASAAQSLPSLNRCSDVAALRAVVRPPEDAATRDRVAALKPRLARAAVLFDAGHVGEAAVLARAAVAEARAAGYLPVTAQALRWLGWINIDKPAEAESRLDEAIWAAEASGDAELLAEAEILQAFVIGYLQQQPARARPFLRSADAILHRIGGHELLRSWLLNNEGAVFVAEGRYEESVAAEKKALALKEKVLGAADDADVARTLGNIADPLAKLGRFDEALAYNARALEMFERSVGGDHPEVANHLLTRAEMLIAQGRFAEGEAPARRALKIWEREYDAQSPFVGNALVVLGRSYLGQGRADEAVACLKLAYSIAQRAGPGGTQAAETGFALARAIIQSHGDRRGALALAVRARDTYDRLSDRREADEVQDWLRGHDGGRTSARVVTGRAADLSLR